MCLMCLDIECKKESCKNIKCKRYFLPLVVTPVSAIHPDVFNFYYLPLVVSVSAFILFWNFPKIVYYTASRPLYYEDLFIDEKKLPNYQVSKRLRDKFQNILEWVLIITNTLLVAGLSDWWLYKANSQESLIEILGVTGGIIKMFQMVNNTISRVMLKILRKQIRKENIQENVDSNEESGSKEFKIEESKCTERKERSLSFDSPKNFRPNRKRFDTI